MPETASHSTPTYTISDCYRIAKEGFDYAESVPQLDRFNSIIRMIDDSKTIVTWPEFKAQTRVNISNITSNNEWKTLCESKLNKTEGIEQIFNEMRMHMNKLSSKKFDSIQLDILESLNRIFSHPNYDDSILARIGTNVFEAAAHNKFYSGMYAKLYANIIYKYPQIHDSFEHNCDAYKATFDTISYADPDVDYDEYCVVNKQNEKRKATSTLFVNLVKENVINTDALTGLINTLITNILTHIDNQHMQHAMVEYVENLAILYDPNCVNASAAGVLDSTTAQTSIAHTIQYLGTLKTKEHNGLTNKTMFKLQDIAKKC